MSSPIRERLSEVRRRFHRYPEPAWREFTTTSILLEELTSIGVDELAVGPGAYDPEDRMAIPDDEELESWFERAREYGVDDDLLERMRGGNTGAIAVSKQGDGPVVGLRVDIDGLFIDESTDDDHVPAAEGFRSEYPGTMHACGHDAHMTIGLATLEAVQESAFEGTLVVFFQPAEEESGGGHPMAESTYADDLDYLLAVHVGLGHPTGEVVAGIEKPLAMAHLTAEIEGTGAHAGQAPNEGDNAIQAAAAAIQNAYGIPRHADGMTRVNIGRMKGGSASNVIADRAKLWGEVRGETTELMEYMHEEFERTVEHTAAVHGCEASVEAVSTSPRADSDPELVDLIYEVVRGVDDVDSPVRFADFGASEDATFLMQRVQDRGGLASYLIVGTDHPTSHHTPTFDVDERTIPIAVEVLTQTIERLGTDRPTRSADDAADADAEGDADADGDTDAEGDTDAGAAAGADAAGSEPDAAETPSDD